MQNIDYQVRNEQYKDLKRKAENERLVRSIQYGQNDLIKNARQAIGHRLVQVGHQLLDEH